ncbi:MAG: LytTR family DNA-binding domain-containing protein [Pseudomonadota bacterium]|nr:LytTR family DNA-binding domain-containing protein [Pseudomonadota bacterium]
MRVAIQRKILIVLVMSAIAVMTGPFGTFSELVLVERLAYWPLALAGVSTIIISIVHLFLMRLPESWHPVLRILLGSFVAGPFGAAWLLGIDMVMRGETFTAFNFGFRWVFVTVIGFGISLVEGYFRPRLLAQIDASKAAADTPETAPEPEPPLFIRNLDPDLGADLISITTQDHYLDVVTAKGESRILKRMSDALAELNGFPGMQIHRSHWVALDAVERVEKDGRKCLVVLKNGTTLPVSRPNVPVLTEALENR